MPSGVGHGAVSKITLLYGYIYIYDIVVYESVQTTAARSFLYRCDVLLEDIPVADLARLDAL